MSKKPVREQFAEEQADLEQQLRNDNNQLREELAAAQETIEQLQHSVLEVASEVEEDAMAYLFLRENCIWFKVSVRDGSVSVSGCFKSETKIGGFIERFVPRQLRANGQPPYIIHESETYKELQVHEFDVTEFDTTLDAVVKGIVDRAPGDNPVGHQQFTEDRAASYGDSEVWVIPVKEEYPASDLEVFIELPLAPVALPWFLDA